MTETILITGSNRGIGLELAHQYAAEGWQVLACCRRPDQATALNQLADKFPDITLHTLDVTQQDQVQKLAVDSMASRKSLTRQLLLKISSSPAKAVCAGRNVIYPRSFDWERRHWLFACVENKAVVTQIDENTLLMR